MSHQLFVLGYRKGSLGCSVRTLAAVRLFYTNKFGKGRALSAAFLWLAEFLAVALISVLIYTRVPVGIGLFFAILGLSLYYLVLSHQVAELVMRRSLDDAAFFQLATAKRALVIVTDDEQNLPATDIVVPMPSESTRRRAGEDNQKIEN
jgi:hypothetical protein